MTIQEESNDQPDEQSFIDRRHNTPDTHDRNGCTKTQSKKACPRERIEPSGSQVEHYCKPVERQQTLRCDCEESVGTSSTSFQKDIGSVHDMLLMTRLPHHDVLHKSLREDCDHITEKYNDLSRNFNILKNRYESSRHHYKVIKTELQQQAIKYKARWKSSESSLTDIKLRLEEVTSQLARTQMECTSWRDFVDKLLDLAGTQKSTVKQLQGSGKSSDDRREIIASAAERAAYQSPTDPPLVSGPMLCPETTLDKVPAEESRRENAWEDEPDRETQTEAVEKTIPANSLDTIDFHNQPSVGSFLPNARTEDGIHGLFFGDSSQAQSTTHGSLRSKRYPGKLLTSQQPGQIACGIDKLSSSQTTDCDSGSSLVPPKSFTFHISQDDDIPEFVSFRTLKRKREPRSLQACRDVLPVECSTSNDMACSSLKIKHEDSNSSPIGLAGLIGAHNESLDLDEVPADIETPRKRRLQRLLSNNSRYQGEFEFNRAYSEPPDVDLLSHRLSDSFEMEIEQHPRRYRDTLLESSNAKTDCNRTHDSDSERHLNLPTPLERNVPSSMAVKTEVEEDESMDLLLPSVPLQVEEAAGFRTNQAKTQKDILQPLSTNSRLLPRTSENKPRSSSRRKQFPLGEVSEDGEQYLVKGRNHGDISRTLQHININQSRPVKPRVHKLLENPTPNRRQLAPSDALAISTTPLLAVETERSSPVRIRQSPQAKASTRPGSISAIMDYPPERCTSLRNSDTLRARPEDEPFRARPVGRLSLDDFKVNPKVNQGYEYAFNEVVRNRNERSCLPGCTRPACCGDRFRKMVEAGGALPAPTRGLWDSSQDGVHEPDHQILKTYLGNDAQARLDRLNAEEREELLIQAKADQLAQKHGKHRGAFQRSITPPGFWRTDMPTTQETVEDRQAAKKLERDKVEERYREAMRPGGRWLFRDE